MFNYIYVFRRKKKILLPEILKLSFAGKNTKKIGFYIVSLYYIMLNKYILDAENKSVDILAPVRLSLRYDHSLFPSWVYNSGENIFLNPKFIMKTQSTQERGDLVLYNLLQIFLSLI